MPIELPDGRIIHLKQYSTRIVRGACPFEVSPDPECDFHVAAVTCPGHLALLPSAGDVVMRIRELEVYRAPARSLREAWDRVRRVDPENAVARASREIGAVVAMFPGDMWATARKLVNASWQADKYLESVNAAIEPIQNEALVRAVWPDAEKWLTRDAAAKQWHEWTKMLVGTLSMPIWLRSVPLRVEALEAPGLEVEIHGLYVAEVK